MQFVIVTKSQFAIQSCVTLVQMPSLSEPQELQFLNERIEQDTFYSLFTLKTSSVWLLVKNDICNLSENQEMI